MKRDGLVFVQREDSKEQKLSLREETEEVSERLNLS